MDSKTYESKTDVDAQVETQVDALGISIGSTKPIPSPWKIMWQEILYDKIALFSLLFFVGIIFTSFIWAATFDADEMARVHIRQLNFRPGYHEGFGNFVLGTDPHGRDVLSRLVVGARNTFIISFTVAIAASVIGILIGLLSGFYGGYVDVAVMRVVDFFTIIPILMFQITLVTLINPNPFQFGVILTMFAWIGIARAIRMKTLQQGAMAYIEASKTLGTPNIIILFRELLPNIVSFMVINLILLTAATMGIEVGLTFLGFGLPPGTASLGEMVSWARQPFVLQHRWWQWIPAAILIFLMMLSINYVGQALNRAADAKRRSV